MATSTSNAEAASRMRDTSLLIAAKIAELQVQADQDVEDPIKSLLKNV